MKFEEILVDLLDIPKMMLGCLKYYLSIEGKDLLSKAQISIKKGNIARAIFIGHSYNYFASMIPFYYINSRIRHNNENFLTKDQKIKCDVIESDDFVNGFALKKVFSNTVFILVSLSGESPQIKESIIKLQEAGIQKSQIWAITNNLNSFVAQYSGFSFPLNAGAENIIGTKSYVANILVQYIIARLFYGDDSINAKLEDEIRQLIFEIKFYGQDWESHTKNLINFIGQDFQFLYFISKGCSLSSAYQGALHCKEYTRTFGEGISLGLFMHGPFQIVSDSFRCVLIVGDEISSEETINLMEIITRKMGSGKLILINNSRNLSSLGRGNPNVFVFEHTTKNPYLAPIFEIIVLQFLLLNMAQIKGVID
jgi:glucosamine 6-phosphate synthetase-like amidotransferase/phosphosugar isomerase protein